MMFRMILYPILALVVGGLIGYFFTIYVVITLTIAALWYAHVQIKPVPGQNRGSGFIGVIIIGGAIFICFLFSMWIAWLLTGNIAEFGFDAMPLLDYVKRFLLK